MTRRCCSSIFRDERRKARLIRHAILAETNCFTRLLRRRLFQQIPEGFTATIANPLVAFQIKMVATLFGCQPHLVQWFLAVDNDFAAVLKGNG